MTEIKKFSATDFDFKEIARLFNLVTHDFVKHPDDIKDKWQIRDKRWISDRLFLYKNDQIIGYLSYGQGRDENKQNCYFNIFLDPDYNEREYWQLLYNKMLEEIIFFNCNRLYSYIYEHANYDQYKTFLIQNSFDVCFKVREYCLSLPDIDLTEHAPLIERLDSKGIKFYDAKHEMRNFPDHYEKFEKLCWEYSQDWPMPDGIKMTRNPFDQFMKHQKLFEEQHYGVQIIAAHSDKYVGATDIHVYPKSDPHKAWTGTLGVARNYRRQGIATVLKIIAFEKLRKKGIKEVRTDNAEDNPMYKINIALGFTPEPYCIEYQKGI